MLKTRESKLKNEWVIFVIKAGELFIYLRSIYIISISLFAISSRISHTYIHTYTSLTFVSIRV